MFYLIGKTLKHSKSKNIHNAFSNLAYDYLELEHIDELKKHPFDGLNVTIPYKQDIIPFVDVMTDQASRIGAVNTVYKMDNKWIGHNTDYDGFKALLDYHEIVVDGRSCLILGTGATSKTVRVVLEDLHAKKIEFASRKNGIPYEEIKDEYDIIINTTPVGMYPSNELILDTGAFHLEAVVDLIYNPLMSRFLTESSAKIKASGLYMLVYQAYKSHELFLGHALEESLVEEVYLNLKKQMSNIVLVGMPMCGKSTIASMLHERLNRPWIDTDDLIVEQTRTSIPELFGVSEDYFRTKETEAVKSVALTQGAIISTGGGVIERLENISYLKQNGVICYIKRDLEFLMAQQSADRPLLKDPSNLIKLYNRRTKIYEDIADLVIDEHTLKEAFDEYFSITRG